LDGLDVDGDSIEAVREVGDLDETDPAIDVDRSVLGEQRLDAVLDAAHHIVLGHGRSDRRFAGADRARKAALRVEQIEIEDPSLNLAVADANHRSRDVEVEPDRRQDGEQRFAQRQLLQIAAKRTSRAGVDREAEAGAGRQQREDLVDRAGIIERQRQPARRVQRGLARIDLADGERRKLGGSRGLDGRLACLARDDSRGPGHGHVLGSRESQDCHRRKQGARHNLF